MIGNSAEDKAPILARYGPLDTCREVTDAYKLYRYDILKEKYEYNGNDTEQYRREG